MRDQPRLQQDVLEFWFGVPGSAEYGEARKEWFRKSGVFDAAVRERFGAAVEDALAGNFAEWASPRGALARVLLLDQFTRNIYRGTPPAFAGDALALAVADGALARGDDNTLIPVERWFLYMPLQHAESAARQAQSVELFTRLRDATGLDAPLGSAYRHAAVIRRFGRFPQRNAILGRASTADEIQFVATRGSRF